MNNLKPGYFQANPIVEGVGLQYLPYLVQIYIVFKIVLKIFFRIFRHHISQLKSSGSQFRLILSKIAPVINFQKRCDVMVVTN